MWAWVEGQDDTEAEERWGELVNSLSGLFCASLNFIDGTRTTRPVLSFESEGTHRQKEGLKLLHGMLPREVVCTENLTPFLKLLPCKGKAGISSLLDGHKLFDASWQSMAIDVKPMCPSNEAGVTTEDCTLEIEQSVSMALSIPRSMRARHDPIPRPAPIEEIECDEKMPWNSHDACYPKVFDGELGWNLSKIFGRPAKGSCSPGRSGEPSWDVSLSVPSERSVDVSGGGSSGNDSMRLFQLAEGQDFDLNLPRQQLSTKSALPSPPIHASRQMTGHGQERGGMQITIRNPHPDAQRIVYFESLPWFLRPYMHTLSVAGATVEKMFYTPALDRKRGTHLELLLHVPAYTTVELGYEFEKAILRYTEYPPDANRGFDVGAAVVRVLPSNHTSGVAKAGGRERYSRTTSLLLPLPTPDFSMPYNVIILTSTVIALGFGSIFNLLVRRFALLEEVPTSPLAAAVRSVVERVRERVAALRAGEKETGGKEGGKEDGASPETNGMAVDGNRSAKQANGDAGVRNRKPASHS